MVDETTPPQEPTKEVKLTEAQRMAKAKLDSSINELKKAAVGTSVILTLPLDIQAAQLDILMNLLSEAGVIDLVEFLTRMTERVEGYTSECRRAVLSQGGASALAGLRKPS